MTLLLATAHLKGPHIDWAGLSPLVALLGGAVIVLMFGLIRSHWVRAELVPALSLGALGAARFELVVEATGSPGLDFDLLRTLGPNAVLVLTGIPSAGRGAPTSIDGGSMLRNLVLGNQAVVGSVNANRRYFERGRRHFGRFRRLWGNALGSLITERAPFDQFERLLAGPAGGAMKSVLVVSADPAV